MKVPEGFKMSKASNSKPKRAYFIKLQRSLYGLKQFSRIWYNHLGEYLLKEGYGNDPICPCIFIIKLESGFVINTIYIDDLILLELQKSLQKLQNI